MRRESLSEEQLLASALVRLTGRSHLGRMLDLPGIVDGGAEQHMVDVEVDRE